MLIAVAIILVCCCFISGLSFATAVSDWMNKPEDEDMYDVTYFDMD